MKKIIAALLIVVMMFSVSSVALAQDTITRFRLPPGIRCQQSGQTYQCFNLGEYQALLQIDEDLRFLTEAHAADLARVDSLTHASDELQLSLDAATRQIVTLTAERTRLTTQWQEADRALRDLQNRPDWSWIPWTLAAAFAITTLVLGLILGLEHR